VSTSKLCRFLPAVVEGVQVPSLVAHRYLSCSPMPDPIVHFVTASNISLLINLIPLAVFWTVSLIIAWIQPPVAVFRKSRSFGARVDRSLLCCVYGVWRKTYWACSPRRSCSQSGNAHVYSFSVHPSCEVVSAVCMLVTQDIGGANVLTIVGNEALVTRGLRSTVF
jgi:hypothetical protein